jgi:1-acyl-sn-glycerol-3-phosphate acyltransferase
MNYKSRTMGKPEPICVDRKVGFGLTLLMNLTVIPLLLSWTGVGIILFPALFIALKLTTPWDREKISRHLIWIYARIALVLMAPFVRFRAKDLQQNAIKPPCIIVANHLSFFDLFGLALLPFSDVSIIVRDWPFKMFWYAPFMHLAGYVNVENSPWEAISESVAKIFSKGGGILIFPEGHRSRNGQLQQFYSGAFRLAVETGVKIVPLCITGTNDLWPPGRWWLRPAQVELRALKPVEPAGFEGTSAYRTMKKTVRTSMENKLKEMTVQDCTASHIARKANAV